MAADKSYARLGFFLVVTTVVLIATALFFIQRFRSREVIDMVTYTTGNVSGLDVGSPVRWRGVSIGSVEELRIDPRGSLIEVDFEVFLDRLRDIGTNVDRVQRQAATGAFANYRAQIVNNPVTNEAYLLLDVPLNPPPPITLPFTPDRVYMPWAPTMMSTVADRLPALLDRGVATLQTLENVVDRLPDSLERSNRFFTNVERIIQEADLPAFSAGSRQFFTVTSAQMEQIAANLDKTLGPGGTLEKFVSDTRATIDTADLAATTQSTRDAMNSTNLAADDLRRSLPAIRDSLAQLRDLARLLEAQPESVIYGSQPAKAK